MLRFLGRVGLWLLLVVVFTGLVVGGFLGFLYYRADANSLPDASVAFGNQTLDTPAGYDWQLPILRGIVWRQHKQSPGLAHQDLGNIDTPSPRITLGASMDDDDSTVVVTNQSGGTVFSGSVAEWNSEFVFTQNGNYSLVLKAGQAQRSTTPTPPYGFYQYQYDFSVSVTPDIRLSDERAAQGSVVAVQLTGLMSADVVPEAECDLGPIWFQLTELGWVGYLPVTYNAMGGDHDLTVTVGDATLSTTIKVYGGNWTRISNATPSKVGVNDEFKNAVWPFYSSGTNEAFWQGAFLTPVGNLGTRYPYGAELYTVEGESLGRSAGITYFCPAGTEVRAPAGGTIGVSGKLSASGGTVVIDHGCGVKSYLYGLNEVSAPEKGSTVSAGDVVGKANDELVWEVRIGNKSIDPNPLTRTSGGLFYRPRA